ncbi:MAG TPA: hypothetical protein VGG19_04875 [Tepidisphaeraceae bacterium]|jgi:hypothetical protein
MPQLRLKAWAILSAAVVGLCINVGCEKLESQDSQSERHVDQVAQQAVAKEESLLPGIYSTVAGDVEGKSDVATAHARQLQAQAEYNAGTQMMRQASNQASELAMRMIEINHLISTIQTSTALVAGYGHYDSTPIKDQASKEISEIQGSGDQADWVAGAHPIPSLSAVKQTISQLEMQIRQKQDEIAELNKQRATDLTKAEDLAAKADQSTGPAWVNLYKQASTLRKQASNLSTQIDNVTASIDPLQVQLTIARADQQIAQAAITGVNTQATGAEENFAQIAQGATGQDKVERDVYENSGTKQTNASLKAQLDSLMDQAKQVQTNWDAAAKLLSDSAEHFKAAQSAAESLQVRLQARAVEIPGDVPEKAAWDQLKRVYSATTFQYNCAVALQTLGMLRTDEIVSLRSLADLKARATATLQAAKLDVPASVASADFDAKIKEAADSGKDAFTQADSLLQNVSNAPLASNAEKNSGRVARILELYGWYDFGRLTSDDQAATHLSAARDAIKDAMDNGAALPILPAEIEPHIAMPAWLLPVASSQPTTAPAAAGAPADAATVASIKQSAHDAIDAMQSGDAARIKQFIIAPPEMNDVVNSIASFVTSSVHLQKAITTKFGDQAKSTMSNGGINMTAPTPEQIDAAVAQAQFTSTGPDTVSLKVTGSPEPLPLKKNGKEWAIDLTTAMKDQPQLAALAPMMSKMFDPMATSINQIATDVDNGKYQNAQQVQQAVQKAVMAIAMPAMQNAQANQASTTAPAPNAH